MSPGFAAAEVNLLHGLTKIRILLLFDARRDHKTSWVLGLWCHKLACRVNSGFVVYLLTEKYFQLRKVFEFVKLLI